MKATVWYLLKNTLTQGVKKMWTICNKCQNYITDMPLPVNGFSYHDKCVDSLPDLIKGFFRLLMDKPMTGIYLEPNIPPKKLSNAISSYAPDVLESSIVALYDCTVFGGAKEGLLITSAGFYFKESSSEPVSIKFNDIESVDIKYTVDGKKQKEVVEIVLSTGHLTFSKEDFPTIKVDVNMLYLFLKRVVKMKEEGKVDETDKYIIIEDMDEKVKINYLKISINMICEDNRSKDGKMLSELQLLMARLRLNSDSRYEVRKYIENPKEETNILIKKLENAAPKGSQKTLCISLIKDLTIIVRKTDSKESVYSSKFINRMLGITGNNRDILELIQQSCDYDEMIMQGNVDEKTIQNFGSGLAASASAIGVPITALYLSGSVVGLSAAGITSGLAALGVGGIFGLSSMLTGVGAVVMLGLCAYKGIKWLLEKSPDKDDITSKREFMIQEIFKIHQKTISNMAEDISSIALQVVDLTKSSEINRNLVDKLGKELTVLAKAHQIMKSRSEVLESSGRLEVLANAA
jgi:hypothetical protein